jgi:hypothetical protein
VQRNTTIISTNFNLFRFNVIVLQYFYQINIFIINIKRRSQWARGLRRRSAAERLLGSRVRIPPGAWIFFLLYSVCVVR